MVGEFSGWTVYRNGQSEVMANRPSLEELERLYSSLTPEERDELLQCLLTAAPRGGEAMLKTLEDHLLCAASETFTDHDVPPSPSITCETLSKTSRWLPRT